MPLLKKPKSFFNRIIILVLCMEVFVVGLWGIVTYKNTRLEQLRTITNRLWDAGDHSANEVKHFYKYFEHYEKQLGDLLSVLTLAPDQQEIIVNSFLKAHPDIFALSLIDLTGREYIRTSRTENYTIEDRRDLSVHHLVAAAMNGNQQAGEVTFSKYLYPEITRAVLTGKTTESPGQHIILSRSSLLWLWKWVKKVQIGNTGYVYIADDKLRLIAHPDPSFVLSGFNLADTQVLFDLCEGKAGMELQIYSNFANIQVVGVCIIDPVFQWRIIVEQPVSESFAPLRRIIFGFTFALVLAFVLSIPLIIYFTRLTIRPLSYFIDGIKRVASGERQVRVRQPESSELAALADAFNTMAQSLDTKIEELLISKEETESAKADIQQLLQRLQSIMSSLGEGVCGLDTEDRILFMNHTGERLLGWSEAELLGENFQKLFCRNNHGGKHYDALGKVLSEKTIISSDDQFFSHRNGEIFPVFCIAAPLRSDGQVIGAVISFRDISESHKRQAALNKAQAVLQAAIEASPVGIVIADAPDVTIRMANSAALEVRDETPELLTGVDVSLHTTHWQVFRLDGKTPCPKEELPLSRAISTGEVIKNEELIIRRPDGENRRTMVNAAPVYDSKGNITAGVVVFLDITEVAKLESKLHQAQKMEAIGTLAGGIAHDFNNILAAIFGYTELALMNMGEPDQLHQDLKEVFNGAERARTLVKQILTFSRRTKQDKQPLQISLVVKEALKMLRATIPTNIEIKEHIDTHGVVLSDPTQIYQIIMNLCTNSYHAMRETGGILGVTLQNFEITKDDYLDEFDLVPGPYLKLEVSDTGTGMDEITKEKIFEPYFTTKKMGEGTGLGLAVVHGIIKDYNGHICVYSEPGEGTTFHVFLPVFEGSAEDHRSPSEQEEPLEGGTERIMVVDDEEKIVSVFEKILTKYGYTVSTFSNGVQALHDFQENPDNYDLVITDMAMPYMTGSELAQKLMEVRPNIAIILCTGYSEIINKEKVEAMGVKEFVQKPLVMSTLLKATRRVLDSRT